MGFFDGLDAEKYDRTYNDRELARRILFAHVLKIAPDQVRYEELA